MNERDQALQIANMWLDFRMNALTQMIPGDPDCDACVLARQFIRATDQLAAVDTKINELMATVPLAAKEQFDRGVHTAREAVAAWMMQRGYATGHGDSTEDLLIELEGQLKERGARQ